MSVSLAPPALISPVFVPPRFIPSATGYPPSFFLVPSYPSPLSSPRFRPLSLPLHAVLLYLYLSLSVSRLVTRSLTPVSVTSSPTPLDWPTLDVSLSLSLSLSLALPLLDTLRPVPSLPRSLTPVSSLSSRVRNSHRFAYVRSYRGRTSLHPPPLGRPLAPPTASTSPLLRAHSDLGSLSLSLSLDRARTHHAHTTPLFFLFPISLFSTRLVRYLPIIVPRLFPLTFVALTIVMRCFLILADIPLLISSGEYLQNSRM